MCEIWAGWVRVGESNESPQKISTKISKTKVLLPKVSGVVDHVIDGGGDQGDHRLEDGLGVSHVDAGDHLGCQGGVSGWGLVVDEPPR